MNETERTSLRRQINAERNAIIRRTLNSEKMNETRNSFERSPLYTLADELGRWTVGTDIISVIYVEYRSCKKPAYWVHRNGTLLGWGCVDHARDLVNKAAGRPVWTYLGEEL